MNKIVAFVRFCAVIAQGVWPATCVNDLEEDRERATIQP